MGLAALGRERARPARLRDLSHAGWLAVATVCLGAFMGQLDASIVTLTYAPLGSEFGASLARVQWVSLSYLLALVVLLIPFGRLADARGRKLLYLYGFVVFTAASTACALAPSIETLIAFRVVQGIGAALLQATSVALVVASAPAGRLRAALGVQAAVQGIGLAVGPTVGGFLVSTLGWRWVFGLNAPIGVLALVAGVFLLPRTRELSPTTGWDRLGLVLLTVAATTGLLFVSVLSGLAVPVWAILTLPTLMLVAAAGFLLHERRTVEPILDLGLVRPHPVRFGLLGAFCGYLVLFGPLVLVPAHYARTGSSEVSAGLVVSALPVGFAFAAIASERLLPRSCTERSRCLLGGILSVAALAGLSAAPLTAGWLLSLLGLLGAALGVFIPSNNSVFARALPSKATGSGSGLLNMTRSLGTAGGVALVTLALQTCTDGPLLSGPRIALLGLTTVAAVMLLSACLIPVQHYQASAMQSATSTNHAEI